MNKPSQDLSTSPSNTTTESPNKTVTLTNSGNFGTQTFYDRAGWRRPGWPTLYVELLLKS